jgi:hypothetical protein
LVWIDLTKKPVVAVTVNAYFHFLPPAFRKIVIDLPGHFCYGSLELKARTCLQINTSSLTQIKGGP